MAEHGAPCTDFDHTDPGFVADPYPTYQSMRAACPVARSERFGGFWVLTRYDDVYAAASDPETFCSRQGVTMPVWGGPLPVIPMESDPPQHTKYRHALQAWFSPGAVKHLEDDVRQIVTGLIDEFVDDGRADLAAALALPLPPTVIAHWLGLPEADWPYFREITDRMLATAAAEDIEANMEAAVEFCSYLLEQLEDRKRHPQDDILSRLVAIEIDGAPMSDDEQLGMTLLLIVAGHETTVGALGTMLLRLAQFPDQRERLQRDPTLIPSAVEEALRFDAPVTNLARTLTRDVALHGQTLKAGDKVLLVWAAANRDDDQFSDAAVFRIDRRQNRHLTFGAGVHRCLGAHLARLEMRVLLEEVLRRIPDYRLDESAPVVINGGQARAVRSLPVMWSVSAGQPNVDRVVSSSS